MWLTDVCDLSYFSFDFVVSSVSIVVSQILPHQFCAFLGAMNKCAFKARLHYAKELLLTGDRLCAFFWGGLFLLFFYTILVCKF